MKRFFDLICTLIYVAIGIGTATIGHAIHHSIFWSLIDLVLWPAAWCKWFLCQEVSISVIKGAFAFFLR